jgi:hypothetical protein
MRKKYRDKIKYLTMDNNDLWAEIKEAKERLDAVEKKYIKVGEPVEDDALILELAKRLKAMGDYLKLEFYTEWENDPQYLTPQPRKRPILKARKQR